MSVHTKLYALHSRVGRGRRKQEPLSKSRSNFSDGRETLPFSESKRRIARPTAVRESSPFATVRKVIRKEEESAHRAPPPVDSPSDRPSVRLPARERKGRDRIVTCSVHPVDNPTSLGADLFTIHVFSETAFTVTF